MHSGIRKSALFICLVLFTTLSCCRGPNQVIYDSEKENYTKALLEKDPAKQKSTLKHTAVALAPLLRRDKYIDSKDIKQRAQLMRNTSLLLSAILKRIDHEADSLTLYMNAYVLTAEDARKNTFQDLLVLLPETDLDLSLHKAFTMPPYSADPPVALDAGKFLVAIRLQEDPGELGIQAACGETLYRLQRDDEFNKKLADMTFNAYIAEKVIAVGHWDSEKDELVIKRL